MNYLSVNDFVIVIVVFDILAGSFTVGRSGFDATGFGHHVRDVLILIGDTNVHPARMEDGTEPALVVATAAAFQRLLDHVECGRRNVVLGVFLLYCVLHRLADHFVQFGAVHVSPHTARDLSHQDNHQKDEKLSE